MDQFNKKIINPKNVTRKEVGAVRISAIDRPYYWLELSESETGTTTSRPIFGKPTKGGDIFWPLDPDEVRKATISKLMECTQLIVINPADYVGHIPGGFYVPRTIIRFVDETLLGAVLGNKRRIREYHRGASSSSSYDQPHYEYEEYGGPSDGYGGRLDDDFINDVLDGDPDAYWNID